MPIIIVTENSSIVQIFAVNCDTNSIRCEYGGGDSVYFRVGDALYKSSIILCKYLYPKRAAKNASALGDNARMFVRHNGSTFQGLPIVDTYLQYCAAMISEKYIKNTTNQATA